MLKIISALEAGPALSNLVQFDFVIFKNYFEIYLERYKTIY